MTSAGKTDILDAFMGIRTRLAAVIHGCVRCQATTADLVQETFLRLWERKEVAAEARDIAGYFIATGRNLAVDHERRKRVAPFVAGIEHLEHIADLTPSPEDHAASRQELRRLRQSIDRLPPRCREVFVLARIEGLTYAQIGDRLQISPKTVFSHMVTALERLRAEAGR